MPIELQFADIIKKTPFMWPDSIIHLFVGGSGAHGAVGNKPTDLDLNGVYIQPVEFVLGIPQMREDEEGNKKRFDPDTQVWSSSGDHAKNTAGDVDLNLYSLRKWANMAATGNTTALEFLFVENKAPKPDIWNKHIYLNKDVFLSARAGFHFLEFAKNMLKRLKGEGMGKHGQRPELEQEFGYDVKAAMHVIRVLCEGIELMKHGRITLPRPEVVTLKGIRSGDFKLEEIERMYADLAAELQQAQANSKLPAEIDRAGISRIITEAQKEFWSWHSEPAQVLAKALNIAVMWIAATMELASTGKAVEIGNTGLVVSDEWKNEDRVKKDLLELALKLHRG